MMEKKKRIRVLVVALYFLFMLTSVLIGFDPGKQIGHNFLTFSKEMLLILPGAFILIGLFEVWVKRESIERHFGEKSGIRGYIWSILLAGTTVGGLYVAFPVAYSLYHKGARLSVILTYISASGICRIPMAIFEASFLGVKFSLVRLFVSIPLVILSSIWLGNYLERRDFTMMKGR
jgi:uncharacterized membrane protein YraQ (UPF0718 family)